MRFTISTAGCSLEAGYISVYKVGTMRTDFYWLRQLKWDGVQFLKMFTDESFWQPTKKEATSKGVNMALDVPMEVRANLTNKL